MDAVGRRGLFTMTIVTPPHKYFSVTHLAEVIADMGRLGAPRIRAYLDGDSGCWMAREGTHRLRAAGAMGLAPIMISVPWWRSARALERARWASAEYGHRFSRVSIATEAA